MASLSSTSALRKLTRTANRGTDETPHQTRRSTPLVPGTPAQTALSRFTAAGSMAPMLERSFQRGAA